MLIGVIADDVSGAAGVAGDFARFGLTAHVISLKAVDDAVVLPGADVVVIDTDSRACEARESAARHRRAAAALSQYEPTLLILKIDSLLRGSAAANFQEILDMVDHRLALILSAVPEQGRTTVNGIQHVDSQPLIGPDGGAVDVVRIFSQGCRQPVHRLTAASASPHGQNLDLEKARGIVVADAGSADDISLAIGLCLRAGVRILAASYGIAEAVLGGMSLDARSRAVLAVTGSVSMQAREQALRVLLRGDVTLVRLDPLSPCDSNPDSLTNAAERVIAHLQQGRDVLVHTFSLHEDSYSDTRHPLPDESASGVVQAFCKLVLPQVSELLGCVVLTGGATAQAFLRAAHCTGLELTGVEAAACSPISRVEGGPLQGLHVITKPGAFGSPTTLSHLIGRARIAALAGARARTAHHESPNDSRRRRAGVNLSAAPKPGVKSC